jgi:hypothetical protein
LALGPFICRLVASLADPAPMLMHIRRVLPDPPEQVTVSVVVVSTAVPGRTLTLPNAIAGMLTVQLCACALAETASKKMSTQPEATIRR